MPSLNGWAASKLATNSVTPRNGPLNAFDIASTVVGSDECQSPNSGCALPLVGRRASSSDVTCRLKVRFACAGNVKKSSSPYPLSEPHHSPLAGIGLGVKNE